MAGVSSRSLLWILAQVTLGATLGAGAAYAERVTICHVPPGNSGREQTISVSEHAVDMHLAHGDHLGECVCEEDPPETACTDGEDNDCDGEVDGEDTDCGFCGDGILQDGEQCDDGNDNPFDGCDQCTIVDTTPD